METTTIRIGQATKDSLERIRVALNERTGARITMQDVVWRLATRGEREPDVLLDAPPRIAWLALLDAAGSGRAGSQNEIDEVVYG